MFPPCSSNAEDDDRGLLIDLAFSLARLSISSRRVLLEQDKDLTDNLNGIAGKLKQVG